MDIFGFKVEVRTFELEIDNRFFSEDAYLLIEAFADTFKPFFLFPVYFRNIIIKCNASGHITAEFRKFNTIEILCSHTKIIIWC